ALVAIDPRNGEILAFVSKPTFDPNLFVDGIDPDNWKELNESIDKPLLNRAIRGTYAPGSTYKPYMALAALTLGKRTAAWGIQDPAVYNFGGHTFHDDKPEGHGFVDMYRSIVISCDIYYFMLANDLGVDTIASFMQPFGFGQPTGIDLEGELRGVLPSTEWKRKAYRKAEQQRWYAGETISLGIGQGYNNYTITQLAKAISILSTGGQRHTPHLVRDIVDPVTGEHHPVVPEPMEPLQLKPEYVEVIRHAMVGVNKEGTGALAFAGAGYEAGGKTGTAQVVGLKAGEKYNAAKVAEHLRDHALFIAFAPADHPTIALAMVLENAGFGGQNAAPIARRVLDYWIKGLYPTDKDIAGVQAGTATAPLEPPVPIALATNVRMGTSHAPGAEEDAAHASGAASAASAAVAGSATSAGSAAAASGAASGPTAAERAAAARADAASAALANAGPGLVASAAGGSAAPPRRSLNTRRGAASPASAAASASPAATPGHGRAAGHRSAASRSTP
ncbi:MAG TPA: penicillin-binding transpeptidase domain-containing protein, partial [Burkholderiaceae bacterium]|nr:penicillin-binding transpeptidase domain-containing protein [Burkholderiaceae bacterium]